ncbi:MAG: hypothetical protein DIU56_014875 [Pseudomonadota bacterium]|nr:MAG: hypothetical protein DIU56_15715 [Pseudomonadota bacterium]
MKNALTAVCLVALFIGAPDRAEAQSCNRECLREHLDSYLRAVTENRPSAARLWVGFRQTENAIVIPEGEGVWKSITALGSVQRRYFDPAQSQAGYFGTVMMGEEEAVVALRLKVEWDQVTEAEWFIARKGDPGLTGEPGRTPFDIETLRRTLPPERVVPPAERMQREALQAIVNTYFDGITSHDGRIVKGHPGCSRYENGFPTFGSPMKPGMDIGHEGKTDCRTQADFGVATVAIRNFFVIDEEAQAVMVSAVFRRDAGNPKLRNHFTELFHIDNGKIRDIHAAFYYAPDDRPVPNWAPYYDGTYPLPASYR